MPRDNIRIARPSFVPISANALRERIALLGADAPELTPDYEMAGELSAGREDAIDAESSANAAVRRWDRIDAGGWESTVRDSMDRMMEAMRVAPRATIRSTYPSSSWSTPEPPRNSSGLPLSQFYYESAENPRCIMDLAWITASDSWMNHIAPPLDLGAFTVALQDARDRVAGFFEYEDYGGVARVMYRHYNERTCARPANVPEFQRRLANLRGVQPVHNSNTNYPVHQDDFGRFYIEYVGEEENTEQLYFGDEYRCSTYEEAVREAQGYDPEFPSHTDSDGRTYIEYFDHEERSRAYYGRDEPDSDYRTCVRLTRQFYGENGRDASELQFPSVNVHGGHWATCKKCQKRALKRTLKSVASSVRNENWCSPCVSEFAESVEGSLVTAEYFADNYAHCKECGFPRRSSAVKDGICKHCRDWKQETGSFNPILQYNAPMSHVVKMFSHPDHEGLNIGVEIELETRPEYRIECAGAIRAIMGPDDVCIKHDGSLQDGFEIVTAANSMEYTRVVLKRLHENRKSGLALFKLVAWKSERCGLHVHISRKPLTDLQIGKIVSFVHNPENRAMIMKIAGRDNKKYGGWGEGKKLKDSAREIERTQVGDHHARYTGVNISNPNTIEFRIFKGTLNPLRVLACIEFVHALTRFCAPCVANLQESASYVRFLEWLNGEERYPNLKQFLKNSDILEDE